MVKICKQCSDPTYCYSILKKCEIQAEEEGIKQLEDKRQSEEFYKNLAEE
jgi:hypothetical protein